VHFHFTPVGSSSINQIETWFGITGQSIRHGTVTSAAAGEVFASDLATTAPTTGNADPSPDKPTRRRGTGHSRAPPVFELHRMPER